MNEKDELMNKYNKLVDLDNEIEGFDIEDNEAKVDINGSKNQKVEISINQIENIDEHDIRLQLDDADIDKVQELKAELKDYTDIDKKVDEIRKDMANLLGIQPFEGIENENPFEIKYQLDDADADKFSEYKEQLDAIFADKDNRDSKANDIRIQIAKTIYGDNVSIKEENEKTNLNKNKDLQIKKEEFENLLNDIDIENIDEHDIQFQLDDNEIDEVQELKSYLSNGGLDDKEKNKIKRRIFEVLSSKDLKVKLRDAKNVINDKENTKKDEEISKKEKVVESDTKEEPTVEIPPKEPNTTESIKDEIDEFANKKQGNSINSNQNHVVTNEVEETVVEEEPKKKKNIFRRFLSFLGNKWNRFKAFLHKDKLLNEPAQTKEIEEEIEKKSNKSVCEKVEIDYENAKNELNKQNEQNEKSKGQEIDD